MKFKNSNVRAQIWVETVLYTLIGLALIGLALAFITPKINEARDRLIIQQSIDSLNNLDDKINEVLQAPGNTRAIPAFTIKRGDFYVNSIGDNLTIIIKDSQVLYSEPGIDISIGRVSVKTEKGNKVHTIFLTLKYSENITYSHQEADRKFVQSSTPYRLSITNEGIANGREEISIEEVSGK